MVESQFEEEGCKKSFIEGKLEDLEKLGQLQRIKRLEKINLFFEEYIVNTSLLDSIKSKMEPNQQQQRQPDDDKEINIIQSSHASQQSI